MEYHGLCSQVVFLLLMKKYRPHLYVMVEQPTSSWMFKQECFLQAAAEWSLERYLTNMGLHGGPILKPTHLLSNMELLATVQRRATKAAKAKFDARIRRQQQKKIAAGKKAKVYHVRCAGGGFQGGPHLQETAVYPHSFISSVYKAWQKALTSV